jgi:hypothetical protein
VSKPRKPRTADDAVTLADVARGIARKVLDKDPGAEEDLNKAVMNAVIELFPMTQDVSLLVVPAPGLPPVVIDIVGELDVGEGVELYDE